ncbi:immunoglobulin-like domain-containing protein [Kiritimatiella glycovorans]|nr:immunoglobulin-like domain-containing protein [Kiritimatiella glycovorans]
MDSVGMHGMRDFYGWLDASFTSEDPADLHFCWGTADGGLALTGWTHTLLLTHSAGGSFKYLVTDLEPDTPYVFRARASNTLGVAWSDPFFFRTDDTDTASVERTLVKTEITYAPGDSADSVRGDVAFSTNVAQNAELIWTTSAPSVISPEGTVYRPRTGPCVGGNAIEVLVTATARKNAAVGSTNFTLRVEPSTDPNDPEYIGAWTPFWRGEPVIGEWLTGGQGFEAYPACIRRSSFAPRMRDPEADEEIPFADACTVVRLIGGWHDDDKAEQPDGPAADLVYRNGEGELQYRWDKLEARLDPYIDAGYTNLTLVLDNIPWCFPENTVTQHYGQVRAPADFTEWGTFVSNMCVALVDLYGFETANGFRFRQGTECQSRERFDGSQTEYFKIYDYSAAAIRSVLPGAGFGPFNNAGGKSNPSANNVDMFALAEHCAGGISYATGETGSPFDFIAISSYVAQPGHPHNPAAQVDQDADFWDATIDRLPETCDVSREIHEFGILKCESGLPTGEPGARGAAWHMQTILGLRERGLDRYYHWGIFDRFRTTRGLHSVLTSSGWFLATLDRSRGGEGYSFTVTDPAEPSTQLQAIGSAHTNALWIYASAFNPDRLHHEPETFDLLVPDALIPSGTDTSFLAVRYGQTNAPHWLMRRDLEDEGLLDGDFAAIPEQLGSIGGMTSTNMFDPSKEFLGDRLTEYHDAVRRALTLAPFDGTLIEEAGMTRLRVTLTPPECIVLYIGPETTGHGTPHAWLDDHGLGVRGYRAADAADIDGDRFAAWKEYIAGTDPTNRYSRLRLSPRRQTGGSLSVRWPAITGRRYRIEHAAEVDGVWSAVASNLTLTPPAGEIEWSPPDPSSGFYRIGVRLPVR